MPRFRKAERLCSKKEIDRLFEEGRFLRGGYLGFRFILVDADAWPQARFLVVVPKKRLRRAVDRNRVKRMLREIIRLRKESDINPCVPPNKRLLLSVIYFGAANPLYTDLEKAFIDLTLSMTTRFNKN